MPGTTPAIVPTPTTASSSPVAHPVRLRELWLLAVSMTISGHFTHWHIALLTVDVLSATAAFFALAAVFVVMVLTTAELNSVLPYAGGAYAITRRTLGFTAGYVVGTFSILVHLFYIADAVVTLVRIFVENASALQGLEPFLWFVTLMSMAILYRRSSRVFWGIVTLVGGSSLAILALYCLSALWLYRRSQAEPDPTRPKASAAKFLKIFPLPGWMFLGVEALGTITDLGNDNRVLASRAQRAYLYSLLLTSIVVFALSAALPPHELTSPLPFTQSFADTLGLSTPHASLLSAPAMYVTAYCLIGSCARILTSMASSGLLSRRLYRRIQRSESRTRDPSRKRTNDSALGTVCVVSYLLCLIAHYAKTQILFTVCLGFAFVSWMLQLVTYVTIRLSPRILQHAPYRSPFGIPGALFALIISLVAFISIIGGQHDGGVEDIVMASVGALLLLYYHYHIKKHQLMSSRERDLMLAILGNKATKSKPKPTPAAPARAPAPITVPAPSPEPEPTPASSVAVIAPAPGAPVDPSAPSPKLPSRPSLRRLPSFPEGEVVDMDVPYLPAAESEPVATQEPTPTLSPPPPRRAKTDSNVQTASSPPVATTGPPALSWGRSFFRSTGLERLREETERDLRSAVSGIWPSERSSHGRNR
ncbi:hypothetical protein Poli38472_011762 [Pythium oligandrum]|uniref:Amino acid permease/ SLC12A domain-containing protein n=1 Tax=Pythium oligandrum TaxID=41045 RepID=A0A8K1C830_PYTOL|nr:hypothetical protein Poli38472_011762 [Pythium oligandrum]|eukprot:TMW58174.1 hypothetical protein Poli38472_011762 [Pythium oligandrum]